MHNTTPKKDRNRIVVHVNTSTRPTGHLTQSGAGQHKDKRTARNRTRSQQKRNTLREWE